jgi:hypothetical protein
MSTPNQSYGISGYSISGYGNQPIEALPIGYYLAILTHQYRQKSPKLSALLYVLVKKLDDISECLVQMDLAFDMDFATGRQLDMLGAIHHVSRTLPFQPSGGISPLMDDATYRLLIKAAIARDQWNGRIDSLYAIWNQLFPAGNIVIADNQNMSADIILTGTFSSIIQDMITHDLIIPRPEGVEYTYVFGALPYFGFGYSAGYIDGFDTGHWAG